MINFIKKLSVFFASIIAGFSPLFVWADHRVGGGSSGPKLENFLGTEDIALLINRIADYLLAVGIPIAVIMILYGAITLLTSGGSEEKVKKGRQILLWAVVGVAILLVGKGLISLIKSILGVNV